jgi:signal transduction histidine kinase
MNLTFQNPIELIDRASDADIQRQRMVFNNMPFLSGLLDTANEAMSILNHQRQILFANQTLLEMAGAADANEVLGKRIGEVLGCLHAQENVHGCGTTEACQVCGALVAILNAQQGKADIQECRILQSEDHLWGALDLRVWAAPLQAYDEPLIILAAANISSEKRRRILERIFFHDVLNTAGGLRGMAELMQWVGADEIDEYKKDIYNISNDLIEEILAQKDLVAAESDELGVEAIPVHPFEVLQDVVEVYRLHESTQNRKLSIATQDQGEIMVTDKKLLKRVLGNMIKNALEASKAGETVTVGTASSNGGIEFWVHNPAYIPRQIQLQIFQRSFSTKGSGRGLGTYSIRLLSEHYLQGKVSFESLPESGTTFRVWFPGELSEADL